MLHKRCTSAFGVAGLLVVCSVAQATTVVRMSTPELVKRSAMIVQGTVIGSKVVYEDGPSGPANVRTITTIEVAQVFKGQAGRTIQVAGFGGQVDNLIYNWPGIPKFEIGDNTIVMLHKPVADQENLKSLFAPLGRDGHMMVTGFEQGRFIISQDAQGAQVVVRSEKGIEFAGEPAVGVEQQPRQLDEVVAEIKKIVELQRVEAQRSPSTEGDR